MNIPEGATHRVDSVFYKQLPTGIWICIIFPFKNWKQACYTPQPKDEIKIEPVYSNACINAKYNKPTKPKPIDQSILPFQVVGVAGNFGDKDLWLIQHPNGFTGNRLSHNDAWRIAGKLSKLYHEGKYTGPTVCVPPPKTTTQLITEKLKGKKILVLGHGRHGKDTVAEILRDTYGVSFESSSKAAMEEFLFDSLRPIFNYESYDECYKDRHNHRGLWAALITAYNSKDRTKLAKVILENSDMYVGMRKTEELGACIKENMFDYIFWVHANERCPMESHASMDIKYDKLLMIPIANNKSEIYLPVAVEDALSRLLKCT